MASKQEIVDHQLLRNVVVDQAVPLMKRAQIVKAALAARQKISSGVRQNVVDLKEVRRHRPSEETADHKLRQRNVEVDWAVLRKKGENITRAALRALQKINLRIPRKDVVQEQIHVLRP